MLGVQLALHMSTAVYGDQNQPMRPPMYNVNLVEFIHWLRITNATVLFFPGSLLLVLLLLPPLYLCLLLKPQGYLSQTPSTSRLTLSCSISQKIQLLLSVPSMKICLFLPTVPYGVSSKCPQIPDEMLMLFEWTV